MQNTKISLLGENFLLPIWKEAVKAIDPIELLKRHEVTIDPGEAVICWGKAALSTWSALQRPIERLKSPCLVIAPGPKKSEFTGLVSGQFLGQIKATSSIYLGEHPLPGRGSFEAGRALIEFFDSLRRSHIRRLRVFLSGGASSLAWVKPASLSEIELQSKLIALYERALPIAELNSKRSALCALKSGGAALWAKRLVPDLQIQVEVISDVLPFGFEVIGSGPFCDGKTPHRVLADNSTLLTSFARTVKKKNGAVPIIFDAKYPGVNGSWTKWVKLASTSIHELAKSRKEGVILIGGEPIVALPSAERGAGLGARLGGRQSHIALALLIELWDCISEGTVELLAMSSDGVDGHSGSAGSSITQSHLQSHLRSKGNPFSRSDAKRALTQFDSAFFLGKLGALIPEAPSGTNVQDLLAVHVNFKESSSKGSSRLKLISS